MSDFWGAEWPRIEKELRKQDGWADYDMKKLPKLMPMEEALPHIRSRLMWSPAKRQGVFTMFHETGWGSGLLEDRDWIKTKAPAAIDVLMSLAICCLVRLTPEVSVMACVVPATVKLKALFEVVIVSVAPLAPAAT